jgi:MFS family permease
MWIGQDESRVAGAALSVLNAGMLTTVPFGAAMVVPVALGHLSDRPLWRDAVHAGRRRSMLTVMLIGAASILLLRFFALIGAAATLTRRPISAYMAASRALVQPA